MRRLRSTSFCLSLALLLAAVGCGDRRGSRPAFDAGAGTDASAPGADGSRPGTDGSVPSTDGGVPGTDADRPRTDGGGASTDAGGGIDAGPPIALCRIGCTTASDCTSASPAFDADNYRCDAGACVYTGCNTDAECEASFSSTAYRCSSVDGFRLCVQECAAPSDCGGGGGAFDADNYRCDAGACVYTGCNTDAECAASFSSSAYVCREAVPPDTGLPLPTARRNCVLGCTTSADCTTGTAAFDADNYRCEGGACRYSGCNDDAECRASFMSSGYVCR